MDNRMRPPTSQVHDGADDEAEAERQSLDPSRWWFASTACPLLAGTFGPMANAFNICALCSYWREQGHDPKKPIPDPTWLLAINAISLACSLSANIALLYNMAGRARFHIAQPVTVTGFFVASILLIGLLAKSSAVDFINGHERMYNLTQAYYYAIWAAAISMILAALMFFTTFGALKGKYEKRFHLTVPQRTLMLQTISLMAYLLIGAAAFGHLEHWAYLDALFWADFTLLTIGLGSPLVPLTHTGRSLLLPYALGGIITVGLIVSSIRTMLLDTAKDKIKARTTEKMRTRVHSFANKLGTFSGHVERTSSFQERIAMPEEERRQHEFYEMRSLQREARKRNKWLGLALSTSAACILWFVGALVFRQTEHVQDWTYFVSLYFSYTTLLTIGYGDYGPLSNSGRSFFVLWSLLAIPTLTVLISSMGDTVVKGVRNMTDWAGTLLFLPEPASMKANWRTAVDFLRKSPCADHEKAGPLKGRLFDMSDEIRSRLAPVEIAHSRQVFVEHRRPDAAFHMWLLAREAAAVLTDMRNEVERKYAYEEWVYFLRLLGHDESKPELHRREPPSTPSRHRVRFADADVQLGRPFDSSGRIRPWSWTGIRSPLMSAMDEPEWVLLHLLDRLRRGLEDAGDEADVPVQLSMLDPDPTRAASADS